MIKPWTVTIDDGYCAYAYQFDIGEDIAIYDIAKAIAKVYNIPLPEGKHIKDGRIDNILFDRKTE